MDSCALIHIGSHPEQIEVVVCMVNNNPLARGRSVRLYPSDETAGSRPLEDQGHTSHIEHMGILLRDGRLIVGIDGAIPPTHPEFAGEPIDNEIKIVPIKL